ncbi:MAG: N-acetyltransferase [Opitutaceae bacterium]|nr:N-acetyltransferase [Opitutaceae bacterium]
MSEPAVQHHAAPRRYTVEADGGTAFLEYELEGAVMTFTHTFVPPELRGRGLAEILVRRALADARDANRRVVPQCSYVARFIARHAEFQPLCA